MWRSLEMVIQECIRIRLKVDISLPHSRQRYCRLPTNSMFFMTSASVSETGVLVSASSCGGFAGSSAMGGLF